MENTEPRNWYFLLLSFFHRYHLLTSLPSVVFFRFALPADDEDASTRRAFPSKRRKISEPVVRFFPSQYMSAYCVRFEFHWSVLW